MAQVTAFPNTNYFLHSRSLDQVDWLGLLDVEAVTIVLAPVVLRALDTKKELGETTKASKESRHLLEEVGVLLEANPARVPESVPLRAFRPRHVLGQVKEQTPITFVHPTQEDAEYRQ